MNEIIDIYWDRIYLHIIFKNQDTCEKEYAIVSANKENFYPVFVKDREIVLNITNIYHQEMLQNGNWFLMQRENQNDEWQHISVSMDVCYKLQELDKIYRYRDDAYAYIYSFAPMKKDEIFVCKIQTTFMMKNMHAKRNHFCLETKRKKIRVIKFVTYILESVLNILYQCIATLIPKNGKNILLMSETRDFGGNLKKLDERLKERGLDKKFHISYFFHKTMERRKYQVLVYWLKLIFITAKQDYIFVDDYTPFFDFIKLNPKTKLIQVWHAGVGFKSVGYARFGKNGSPHPYNTSHRKYDYAIVGGEALRDVYAEVFGIDREKCLPYGLMRNDGYMEKEKIEPFKKAFYEKYKMLKGKKIILFAPTFRGVNQKKAFFPYEMIDQKEVSEMCGEKYVFLIKVHPFVTEKIQIEEEYKNQIIDFSDFPDINQLFYVTDILITDYSSNIYEFAMHRRPMIFWAYDKEEYELVRSVHRRLDDSAPGKVCKTLKEVKEAVLHEDFEMEKLDKFIEENFENSNEYAADKVIDHILLQQ